MSKPVRIGAAVAIVLAVVFIAYTGYVGAEGARMLIEAPSFRDCRTPANQFGWAYEAINYDIADDAQLAARNKNLEMCTYQGAQAGDAVVTDDGIHVAGWYVPAANGAGPTAPTVVLVHGFTGSKSSILKSGEGLHATFNLVALDLRNTGRSTGDQTTGGVLERKEPARDHRLAGADQAPRAYRRARDLTRGGDGPRGGRQRPAGRSPRA